MRLGMADTVFFLMHVHLIFVTKYRREVFTKTILDDLKLLFDAVCKDFEAELVEFDGEDDHVHLLVNYPPKVAISILVNSLKGISSRMIRKKNYPSITKKLGAVHCGLPATLPEVVAVHLSRLFGSTSSSSKRRIERLRRLRLHPHPERRGFAR